MFFNELNAPHLNVTERDQANALLDQLQTLLRPKLIQLTSEERRKFGSVNELNKLLINKTRDYRRSMPHLSDPDIDWVDFEASYQDRESYEMLIARTQSFLYDLESTKIIHDYKNHQAALSDYSDTNHKAERKRPEYIQKATDMRQLFPRTPRSKDKDDLAEDTINKE